MLDGIDVSTYQTTTPPLAGLSFVFARATYDTSPDARYAMHAANVRKAGLTLGAYHFGTGRHTPAAQVQAFLAVAKDADLLCLDLESDGPNGMSMTNTQAQAFIAAIHAAGRKCGLYHSDSGFPAVGQDWNWVARWSTFAPVRPWAFWQYQGSPLDKDHYNGTQATLAALGDRPKPTGLIALPAGTEFYAHKGDTTSVGSLSQQYGLTVERVEPGWTLGSIRVWVKR